MFIFPWRQTQLSKLNLYSRLSALKKKTRLSQQMNSIPLFTA